MTLVELADSLSTDDLALYAGRDPRAEPWYTYPEAARATGVPASTLRSWTVGQRYARKHDVGFFEPVIPRPSDSDPRLSFVNLIEAHVLRALRSVHEVRLQHIREAVAVAEQEFGVSRLLVSPDLRTSAGQLFLDHYSGLTELSEARQLVLRDVLNQFLERVEFDASNLPLELHPFARVPRNASEKPISLSPLISFGRAVIKRVGVSTDAIVERLEAGEPLADVQQDYGLRMDELEEAVLYEAAA